MTYYGIYKITNLTNDKMYIGQHTTTNIDDGYMGSGKIILRALKKYGVENFRKEWLMFCEDEEELNYMERVYVDQTWVDRSDTYNLNLGGNCHCISEQTRKKMSIALKGKPKSLEHCLKCSEANKGKHHSDEVKKKISESNKGKHKHWLGKHHSDESKKKISDANKGKIRSEEARLKYQKAAKGRNKGRILSDEHKRKIGLANIGRVKSKEEIEKISKTLCGHSVSEESRRKMSEKKKGVKHSDEWKKKHAEAIKLWWSKRKQVVK